MQIIKSSDLLMSENKNGGDKFWRLHILADGDNYYTQTEWYQISKTGRETKKQTSEPYFATPTNVGRANERNSEAQAYFEFDAIISKQRDKGFRVKGERKDVHPMPMLAHKFTDHKGKVEFPVYVQPKLNGMRMLFDGENGWSRGNKEVIPEVIEHLKFDTGGYILDGELMLPNNQLLQESMKAIKKYRSDLSPQLIYHVYDIVDDTLSYEERAKIIWQLWVKFPPNVKVVAAIKAKDESEIMKWHTYYTKDGYEGTMIRNPKMTYEIGKRSYSLLKLKDFVDEEFKIVGFKQGNGSFEKSVIFVCEANGDTFTVVPEGSMEYKRELWNDRDKYLNEWLTVRYFEKSKDGIPIFPVGVSIRFNGEF
jgi:DNA ligase-1